MNAWKEYQEQAASYFRSLGLDASTDVSITGVRTTHDVDVVVRSHYAGFDIVWIVECKYWKTPVTKLHVLALREIVTDIGADRGVLLSESGFQSGATEAANLTNVRLTSLDEMRVSARDSFNAMRLRELYDRIQVCKERYWNIPKVERIDVGLRPDFGEYGYSGARTVEFCNDLLTHALRGVFPFCSGSMEVISRFGKEKLFSSAEEVAEIVEDLVVELETKLDVYDCLE